jgi:excisionase family DNA binding protein
MVIHWEGGDHTKIAVKKNRVGQTRWCNDAEVIDLVSALSRHMPDETIAAVLNRSGKLTGHGNTWTRNRVCAIRRQKSIAIYRPGEREERGELTLDEAAAELSVSPSTVRRLVSSGVLRARQVCKGAPWVIHGVDLDRDDVRCHADARRARRPAPDIHQQKLPTLVFLRREPPA